MGVKSFVSLYPLYCNVACNLLHDELSLSFCHVHRGSAIAKIVGTNARNNPKFDSTVNMWVFEETVNGRKLTEVINTDHENVKYLPGHKLPENVVRNFVFESYYL